VSSGDIELLEALEQQLAALGLDPKNLVFSGFDGSRVKGADDVPRYPYIWAMNDAGWRAAIKYHDPTPADHAEGQHPAACIGVYDKSQLREIYSSSIHQDQELDERIELDDIVLGDTLADLPPERTVSEAIVHVGYPEASPTDALLALAFID